jgi:hypothetical protein
VNPFIAITSNGGYIGRIHWSNSNSPLQTFYGLPGQISFWNLPGWPGSLGLIRYFTR